MNSILGGAYMISLTPSKLAPIEDCERLFQLQMLHPTHSVASAALVLGSATHENWRNFTEYSRDSWLAVGIDQIPNQINLDATKAIETTHKLLIETHPEFELEFRRNAALVELAIRQWGIQRLSEIHVLMNQGYNYKQSISAALPLTEVKLKSKEFGIHGRADQVFLNGNIKVTDLKTDERITSFLHEDGHKLQLYAYAVMAEETFGVLCETVSVLYTKSMTEVSFPFDKNARQLITDRVDDARELLSKVHLQPMLTGLEAEAKCPRCYMRDICFRLANQNGELHE